MTARVGLRLEEEYAALVGVLRRFLARRVPPDDVDDIVQEAVARVLAHRPDLTGEALAAYSVVTARNLVVNAARQRRRRGTTAELDPAAADPGPGGAAAIDEPLAALVTAEERAAVIAALDQLADVDRAAIVARDEGVTTAELARRMGTSPGAIAVRLARARAKLRVDYVVALEHASLPTSRCRPVLLALSGHDQQSQRATRAGHHLLDCATCASLAEPLLERRRPVALVLPALLVRRGVSWGRQHPVPASVAALALVVAAIVGVRAAPERAAAAPCPPSVSIGGRALSLADHAALAARSGTTARGAALPVLDVPADEGFWVGCERGRLWVQLVGEGESPQDVRVGQRVDATGRLVPHGPGFAATTGLQGDAARGLDDEGVHLEVAYTDIKLRQS